MVEIYQEQIEAQLEAGVDGVMNETIFDTQNCEAYLHAAMAAMQKTGIRVPIFLSFTVGGCLLRRTGPPVAFGL